MKIYAINFVQLVKERQLGRAIGCCAIVQYYYSRLHFCQLHSLDLTVTEVFYLKQIVICLRFYD